MTIGHVLCIVLFEEWTSVRLKVVKMNICQSDILGMSDEKSFRRVCPKVHGVGIPLDVFLRVYESVGLTLASLVPDMNIAEVHVFDDAAGYARDDIAVT